MFVLILVNKIKLKRVCTNVSGSVQVSHREQRNIMDNLEKQLPLTSRSVSRNYLSTINKNIFAKTWHKEFIDVKIFEKQMQIVHANEPFYSHSKYFRSKEKFCVFCKNTITDNNYLFLNNGEINYYTHCSDCQRKICEKCTATIYYGEPSKLKYKYCDCYLFQDECHKILCFDCRMSVARIIVYHGQDKNACSSLFYNSNYSYRCFYNILKNLFYNASLDHGYNNSIIRIINNFDITNVTLDNKKMLEGVLDYIKYEDYDPDFFPGIMFELANTDLLSRTNNINSFYNYKI